MKDISSTNTLNPFKNTEIFTINSNSLMNYINTNNSFNKSFENLEETRNLELHIIKSKLSCLQSFNYESFEKSNLFSQIKRITEKYKNFPLIDLNQIPNKSTIPTPFINTLNILNIKPYFQNLNFQLIPNLFMSELITKNNIFLNKKRKTPFIQKKNLTNNKEIFPSIIGKDDNEDINSELIKGKNISNKKIIFRLDKKSKNFKALKNKKNPGRKKKNSGEIGVHNKFSKDNMMRKLKNKVMESSRKLINHMVKLEAGEQYKEFGEMRKIQGIFCQELNIKFNYWFYFQSLKTIFQFKMSSKYSKGSLNSNHLLISKIYSNQYKFPKTIELLELKFHQYYHDIFLGEKNWTEEFDISQEKNKYQMDYFLTSNKSKENEEELKYEEKMKKLAKKYELFFLKKNPRMITIQNGEKISYTKAIINNISLEDFEKYKYYFIHKSVQYLPEISNSYAQYLNNKIKNIINNEDFDSNFFNDLKDEFNVIKKNNSAIKKEENILLNNIENESQNKTNDEIRIKTNSVSLKPMTEFNTEKKEFSEIAKKSDDKEEKKEKKKINFIINKIPEKPDVIYLYIKKDKFNKETTHCYSKKLFVITKENNLEKSECLTKSNSS